MLVHILDSIFIILSGLLIVFLLHHDGTDIGQADAFLLVVFVKFIVDMISVSITEQCLGLLFFTLLDSHGLSCQLHGPGHPIEGQMKLV